MSMRKPWVVLLVLACSGCDGEARKYAEKLLEVVRLYEEQVERKIAAENRAYQQLASVYERGRADDVVKTLELERSERSWEMADDALLGRPETFLRSRLQAQLREYALLDFESGVRALTEERDARARFLSQLEDLEFERKKVADFRKALTRLAEPEKFRKQVQDLKTFAQASKEVFNGLVCDDLKTRIQVLQQRKAAKVQSRATADPARHELIDAQIEGLTSQIQGAQGLLDKKTQDQECE